MGQFEGMLTLRCVLLYMMLLRLNQLLSAHLYSRIFSIDLTLDWTCQGEKWHQKLSLKGTQNGI